MQKLLLLLLFSCSYFFEEEEVDTVYKIENMDCEIDPNFINLFTSSDVSKDLNCLQTKLNQVTLIERENRDVVSLSELLLMMNQFGFILNKTQSEKIAVFFKYYSILKDFNQDQLLLKDIDPLIRIAKTINYGMINNNIDFLAILNSLDNIITYSDRVIEPVDSFLVFIKKVLVGGDKFIVKDLSQIIFKLKEIITKEGFDYKNWRTFDYLLLEKYLYNGKDEEIVLAIDEFNRYLFNLLPFKDVVNYEDFSKELTVFKNKMFESVVEDLSFKDVRRILKWLSEFSALWKESDEFIDGNLTKTSNPDLMQLANGIRNYRDDLGYQYFDLDIHFNKKSFQQSMMIYFTVEKILQHYGYLEDGEYRLDFDQLGEVLKLFKPILIPLELWPIKDDRTMTRSILLVNSVAMNSSSGNTYLRAIELTEFIEILISGSKIHFELMPLIKRDCETVTDNYDAFCLIDHYYNYWFDELRLEKYLPRLFQYTRNEEEAKEYALNLAMLMMKYTKEGDEIDRPIKEREIFLMTATTLAVESTYLKYNPNSRNLISSEEAINAYPMFQANFIYLKKLDEDEAERAETFFYFLLTEKEIPSWYRFLWNDADDLKKDVPNIYRKDIALMIRKILDYL